MLEMVRYLEQGELPSNDKDAHKVVIQSSVYCVTNKILYYVDSHRGNAKRIVVPRSLRDKILAENHSGPCAGHFAGHKLYNVLVRHWYWKGTYDNAMNFCRNCPECVTVSGSGKLVKPPLHPIPVRGPSRYWEWMLWICQLQRKEISTQWSFKTISLNGLLCIPFLTRRQHV